ncbi:hypothetical protein BDQ17DRAFT_1337463 [Cyathus striatus]|nr:hypothetical protein BDQ17DRAFT_1337463 [Cyathus striatus]
MASSPRHYFAQTQTVALTVFGITAGFLMPSRIGIGGGFAAVATQTGAQAAAVIRRSYGHCCCPSHTESVVPSRCYFRWYLDNLMPETPRSSMALLYTLPHTSAVPYSEGVISAYDEVMKIQCIVATVFAIFPLILAFFMPNWFS